MSPNAAMRWRIAAFLGLFALMYGALAATWGDGLSHVVIDVCTVEPAAWFARLLSGNAAIAAVGAKVVAPDGAITVQFGCEGTDVLMLLLAALVVAPVSWANRALGIATGVLLVFAANQVRVVGLFFAYRLRPEWFGPIHGLIGPVFMVVVVGAFFVTWLRWAAPARASHAAGL